MAEELTQTSEELLEALRAELFNLYGYEINVERMNTGGGMMVTRIDLSINAIEQTRDIWLTREDRWILGFYNFALDVEDEGITVDLNAYGENAESPWYIAGQVVGILQRLGVTIYDGPSGKDN
jgi:hypothetical protein